MDVSKIKVGKRVSYAIKTRVGVCQGHGTVTQVIAGLKGHRVAVYDKTKQRSVKARPSQVSAR